MSLGAVFLLPILVNRCTIKATVFVCVLSHAKQSGIFLVFFRRNFYAFRTIGKAACRLFSL